MGLTVIVHKEIELSTIDDYSFCAEVIDDDWRDRVKNLQYGQFYKSKNQKMMLSYPCSTHNEFRNELCALLGLKPDAWFCDYDKWDHEKPFTEFFQFADNQGCIDWETSYKLYLDFVQHKKIAKEKLSPDHYQDFKTWTKIFRRASTLGVVEYR